MLVTKILPPSVHALQIDLIVLLNYVLGPHEAPGTKLLTHSSHLSHGLCCVSSLGGYVAISYHLYALTSCLGSRH